MNMKMRSIILIIAIALGLMAEAQGVVITPDPLANPDGSAMVEVRGTAGVGNSGGVLIPRLTEAQRTTLTSTAAEGLWVYQIDENKGFYLFNGTRWTKASSTSSVSGRLNVNTATEALVSATGTGYTVTQPSYPGDPGIFDITFNAGTFNNPPSVMVTPVNLPPISTGIDPSIYCQPVHQNNCVPFFAADYLDRVRVVSCEDVNGSGGGATNCNTDIDDIDAPGCNNTPDNYVNLFATESTILYGPNHTGGPDSFFNITLSSGPEWRDNLFAFIDWNQDADFEDPQEVVMEYYFPNLGFNNVPAYDVDQTEANITVPSFASDGVTVLRAMTLYIVGTPAPCGTFSWGETQDYRVDVVGGDNSATNQPRGAICTAGAPTASGFRIYCTDFNDNRVGTSVHFYAVEN